MRQRSCKRVGLALSAFLVHESIDGAVCRRSLDQSIHDEEQCSSQVGRTILGCAVASPVVVARLIGPRINAGEGGQRFSVREPCGVADLGHKLRPQGRTDAIHGHDDGVFRKRRSDLIHLDTQGFHHLGRGVQQGDGLPNQHPGVVILGENGDEVGGDTINFFGFVSAEIVPLSLAPVSVMLGEGAERFTADAVHMPVGVDKINPLLAAVAAGGAVEETVDAGKGLVKKRDEIVLHGGLLIRVKAELPVHGLQLVVRFVHRTILPQLCPAVKSKSRDFPGIGLVSLGGTEGFVAEVSDELGIDGTDEDTGRGEPVGNGLIITACVLHAAPRFTVQPFDGCNEFIDGRLRVAVIPGRQ